MEVSQAVEASPFWSKMAVYGIDFALFATVAINVFWSFYAKKHNLPEEHKLYLMAALPVSLIALGYYLAVRMKIMKNIKRKLRGEDVFVPHHGVLFLVMIMRVLMLGALAVQAYLALKGGSQGVAGGMSAFESAVDVIFVTMIVIFVKLDKLGAATDKIEETQEA